MRKLLKEPVLLLTMLLIIACLLLFVLYPIIRVFSYPSLKNFIEVPQNLRYLRAIKNSLLMVVLSTSTATLFGFLFAYTITRTEVPFKKVLKAMQR